MSFGSSRQSSSAVPTDLDPMRLDLIKFLSMLSQGQHFGPSPASTSGAALLASMLTGQNLLGRGAFQPTGPGFDSLFVPNQMTQQVDKMQGVNRRRQAGNRKDFEQYQDWLEEQARLNRGRPS